MIDKYLIVFLIISSLIVSAKSLKCTDNESPAYVRYSTPLATPLINDIYKPNIRQISLESLLLDIVLLKPNIESLEDFSSFSLVNHYNNSLKSTLNKTSSEIGLMTKLFQNDQVNLKLLGLTNLPPSFFSESLFCLVCHPFNNNKIITSDCHLSYIGNKILRILWFIQFESDHTTYYNSIVLLYICSLSKILLDQFKSEFSSFLGSEEYFPQRSKQLIKRYFNLYKEAIESQVSQIYPKIYHNPMIDYQLDAFLHDLEDIAKLREIEGSSSIELLELIKRIRFRHLLKSQAKAILLRAVLLAIKYLSKSYTNWLVWNNLFNDMFNLPPIPVF